MSNLNFSNTPKENLVIRSICIIALLFIFALHLSAQDSSALGRNSLREGAWAVQFQVSNNFTLTSFQGTGLSVKHHLSDKVALRVGLGLGVSTQDGDEYTQYTQQDSNRLDRSTDANSQSYDIRTQVMYYPTPQAEINFFLGAGPQVHYSRSRYDSQQDMANLSIPRSNNTGTENSLWAVGIGGMVGVEWFATRSISLEGEYAAAAEYVWSDSHSNTTSSPNSTSYENHRTSKGFQFNQTVVRLGISAYF